MAQALVDVAHLTKHFPVGPARRRRVVHAVEDISFRVFPQEVVCLVGESGSGKSTTARLLALIYRPTSGSIRVGEQDVSRLRTRRDLLLYRRQVQMIFQDPFASLNPVRTIRYHLSRPLLIHEPGLGPREREERLHELLHTVGLTPPGEFLDKFPHELSGGQRQRVVIAHALAVHPKLILADEPISMLDVSIRLGILNLMLRLREEQGITYLYITHDIASARYVGDRILVMYAGEIVEQGPAMKVIDEPAHPYTQLLLSAVPDPAAQLRAQPLQVQGEIPSLIRPPAGCRFHPRCPRAMAVCREVPPPPVTLGEEREVRCHLYR